MWLTTGWHLILIMRITTQISTHVQIQSYEKISTHSTIPNQNYWVVAVIITITIFIIVKISFLKT